MDPNPVHWHSTSVKQGTHAPVAGNIGTPLQLPILSQMSVTVHGLPSSQGAPAAKGTSPQRPVRRQYHWEHDVFTPGSVSMQMVPGSAAYHTQLPKPSHSSAAHDRLAVAVGKGPAVA